MALQEIRYTQHADVIDFAGRNLISVLGEPQQRVAQATGLVFSAGRPATITVPIEKVTSMTGEVADEVHDWPKATQGPSFRQLSFHFKKGRLITLEWKFSLEEFLPRPQPWYRRIFG